MGIGSVGLYDSVLSEDYLELTNGLVVKNLQELIDALKKMNNDNFALHVTKNRNDFAEWILEAYNDERLTQKLLGTKEKNKTIKILENVLKENSKIRKIENPKSKKDVLKNIEAVSYEM